MFFKLLIQVQTTGHLNDSQDNNLTALLSNPNFFQFSDIDLSFNDVLREESIECMINSISSQNEVALNEKIYNELIENIKKNTNYLVLSVGYEDVSFSEQIANKPDECLLEVEAQYHSENNLVITSLIRRSANKYILNPPLWVPLSQIITHCIHYSGEHFLALLQRANPTPDFRVELVQVKLDYFKQLLLRNSQDEAEKFYKIEFIINEPGYKRASWALVHYIQSQLLTTRSDENFKKAFTVVDNLQYAYMQKDVEQVLSPVVQDLKVKLFMRLAKLPKEICELYKEMAWQDFWRVYPPLQIISARLKENQELIELQRDLLEKKNIELSLLSKRLVKVHTSSIKKKNPLAVQHDISKNSSHASSSTSVSPSKSLNADEAFSSSQFNTKNFFTPAEVIDISDDASQTQHRSSTTPGSKGQ